MTTFKIASWNVNSLKVRLPHVLNWLNEIKPDVLAMQETKIIDAVFPYDEFAKQGYVAISSGQKTYNGVAILWKEKALDIMTSFPGFDDPQRRILGVTVGDIRVINLYIPNGQSVGSEKYQYKLTWLNYLKEYLKQELLKYPRIIVLGDFNIAPQEIDVYEPLLWQGKVLFSEPERAAFQDILQLGFVDTYRILNPMDKKFSWWDYRLYAFKRNQGARIDHILASDALVSYCRQSTIDPTPRGWERPSDHAPVYAEFHFN